MSLKLYNDAVEKPHSEHLFQLWVDFFQTKPWFSFWVLVFLTFLHCKPAWPGKPVRAIQRQVFLFSASLSRITMVRQLFNIMHHAVQLPLPIDLGFSAQRKAVQTLVAAQIAKHRFHRRKASRDHLPARIRIDFLFHQIDMIFTGIAFALQERNLPGLDLLGCAQTCLVDVESDPIYLLV